jgi:ATP-dependent exoDNAse (exonuclease V) beta subunit
MCLHLLGGARDGFEPIPCARLGLLTFTEKAADEMRSRLRARLDRLALGTDDEPVLRASFEAANKNFPPPRTWRTIRDELGAATIGTFHSLCSQLLRRAPPGSRVSAGFELLDEREARSLLSDVVERALLARLEAGSNLKSLVAELGFTRLVEGLVPVATRIREEGIAPDYVHVADGPGLRAQFDAELRGLKVRARTVQPATPVQVEQLNRLRLELDAASFETFERDGDALLRALHNARNQMAELKPPIEHLRQTWAACILAPQEAEVRELLTEVFAQHEEALATRGVLDFTGLLIEARNLLRDDLDARADAHRRFEALLVDEFQDTNRLQLEVVLLLAEKRREGGPRPISTAFEHQHREIIRLPQQQGFLAVVGDRKQSIYEFRGADVSVFEVMAKAIEANDGQRAFLRHSRRSTPALLEVLNQGFAHVLGPPVDRSAADFETVWQAEDALLPVRTDNAPGPAVTQLVDSRLSGKLTAEALRQADAEAVATTLSLSLRKRGEGRGEGRSSEAEAGPSPHPSPRLRREREFQGGDIAILFQRFTQLEVYRQALVRHGLRHRVVRGRGFYGAQEVVDVASFLALLADPTDAMSLSAVLRSPFVGLTDAQWIALARPTAGQRWALDAHHVLHTRQPNEPRELTQFRARYTALRDTRDRLGLRALVRVILEEFSFRVSVAAGPFGEQALANLDKLLVLASARERDGASVAAFSSELLSLADEAPREAQAEVVDELDREAITLCTVHQAKGLEWPIVVLPDLAVAPRNETASVRFDREHGLGIVRPRGETELRSLSAQTITEQLARRARAEHHRLLYVAMTRARDQVILGLRHQPADRTWARELDALFPLQVMGERSHELDVATLPKPDRTDLAPATEENPERAAELLATVRAPHRSVSRALVLPVTQLQDHTSCPRRYHLAHQVGLTERHGATTESPESTEEGDARARGVAAHRILELLPLDALGTPRLNAVLKAIRHTEGLDSLVTDDVLGWLENFCRTPFARELPRHTVHRELPFALRVESSDSRVALVLRGQIDLLVETTGELVVIDYKTSALPPSGLEPWRAQLASYAIAARRLSRRALPVRAGIVFLRDPNPEPRFLEPLEWAALETTLLTDAAALERSQRTGVWESRPRAFCESIGCGYVYRCHP